MGRRKRLTLAFGEIVRESRQRAGLSQEQLGFRSGVHPTYISQIERGVKSPSLEVIAAVASALDRPLYTLVRAAEERLR